MQDPIIEEDEIDLDRIETIYGEGKEFVTIGDQSCENTVPDVVVVYHVTIVAIGHGLLKEFWPLVLGCVLRTAGNSII